MKWYNKSISSKDLKKAKEICTLLGIKVIFKADEKWCGSAPLDNIVQIDPYDTGEDNDDVMLYNNIRNFWSSVMHEITHILLYRRGLYTTYHSCSIKRAQFWTDKQLSIVRRTGLKAERMAEKEAAKLLKWFFPGIPYRYYYNDKQHIKSLQVALKNWQ